jgi:hypothetical protein
LGEISFVTQSKKSISQLPNNLRFFLVFAPYCAEYNKNFTGVADVGTPFPVKSLQDCASNCTNTTGCENWYLVSGNVTKDYTVSLNSICYGIVNTEHIVIDQYFQQQFYYCDLQCSLKGNASDVVGVANTNTFVKTFFGNVTTCGVGEDLPALPEEASELAYIATCRSNQLMTESRNVNLWNKTTCPSEHRNLYQRKVVVSSFSH